MRSWRVDRLDAGAMVRVQYPYLAETVEVLQVHKLFEGMNRFLRTMHEFEPHRAEPPTVSIDREAVRPGRDVEPIRVLLSSPFDVAVKEDDADDVDPAVGAARDETGALVTRFDELVRELGRHLTVTWDTTHARADRYGTVWIRDGRLVEAGAPADRRSREELDEASRVRLDEELLERNREVPFVTFGISAKGHVEAWVETTPSSLESDTLRFLVLWLAEEADRLELHLTGRDAH